MTISSTTFDLDYADLQICGKYIMVFPNHDISHPPIELCTVDEMLRMIEAAQMTKGREVGNG